MNDAELTAWVQDISLKFFHRPFLHKAVFNGRLRSTGGRYFTKTHHIEISRLQYETYGAEETEKIIKHELCHYHLHILKKGYRHRDADFRNLLKQVGGTRFCRPVGSEKKREPYRYKLVCVDCGMEYLRKRKVNIRKYACGKCRGKLKMTPLDSPLK
jgi:SprT-like protein